MATSAKTKRLLVAKTENGTLVTSFEGVDGNMIVTSLEDGAYTDTFHQCLMFLQKAWALDFLMRHHRETTY